MIAMHEMFSIYEGRMPSDVRARFSMARSEGWRPGMVKSQKRVEKKNDSPGFFGKLFGAKPQTPKPVRSAKDVKARVVNYSGLAQ